MRDAWQGVSKTQIAGLSKIHGKGRSLDIWPNFRLLVSLVWLRLLPLIRVHLRSSAAEISFWLTGGQSPRPR
jgi:hypothetical protein